MILKPTDFDPKHYFTHYVNTAEGSDLYAALRNATINLTNWISENKKLDFNFKYEADKWSVKQVIQHIVDTERVLVYRAFCMSRKDTTNLPSFDQDAYAENDNTNDKTMEQIMQEFKTVRESTDQFYSHINDSAIDFYGMASNTRINARVLGWVIAGHCQHHINVLNQKYLTK